MKKMTAMQELWDYIDANYHEENFNLYNVKKLSIEKEKEQIIDAHLSGLNSDIDMEAKIQAKQYYNETFKSE
jgi:hypothetical protein